MAIDLNYLDALDQKICAQEERAYLEAVGLFLEAKRKMEASYASNNRTGDELLRRGYIAQGDISYMEKRLEEIRREYVTKMAQYFFNRYKVSINVADILRVLPGPADITATSVIEEIIRQMEGMTFHERAVWEVKTDLADLIKKNLQPEVKGNRIALKQFLSPEKRHDGEIRLTFYNEASLRVLLRALQHFDTGRLELIGSYAFVLAESLKWYGSESPFRKYEIDGDKVRSLRLFQNGKVQITFADEDLASRFAGEYMGLKLLKNEKEEQK